ncbi:uncharacterized protein LOC116062358 [Sander lucioperca]|uniref:uncharacterized protein LOC116062358 n=1 Tax=Sander lucioperca TaxID=283035 RepID=UPI00125D4B80|nr:uncharacterized protein LOC116062358 [Sander lucioperca]
MDNTSSAYRSPQFSTFFLIIVIFTYNVLLQREYECRCERGLRRCFTYAVIPTFILIFLQLWTENVLNCNCEKCWIIGLRILKAVCVGSLWFISLLFKGDWVVCCFHANLYCNTTIKLSEEGQKEIAKKKQDKTIYGFICVFGIIAVAAAMTSAKLKKKCIGDNYVEDEVSFDEDENVLKEIEREKLKKGKPTPAGAAGEGIPLLNQEWVPYQVRLSPPGHEDQIIHVELRSQKMNP